MKGFKAGIASVDITPRLGLPLMGNYRNDYAARGLHDPLMAKAVVFADERENKSAVLSLDLCMVNRDNVQSIRNVISSGCDVPANNVLIHATHTHSGPDVCGKLPGGPDISAYRHDIDILLKKAASAVILANGNLANASIAVGQANEDRVSFNRRLRRKDGSTQMNWESTWADFDIQAIEGPWGPIDSKMTCLVIEREGHPLAAIVNFALHPAILAGDNWLYSADYPGYLSEALSKMYGEHFTTLFLNGCCGDVNHIDYRDPLQGRGFCMTQRIGYMLAVAANHAINSREHLSTTIIDSAQEKVAIDRIKISSEECERCRNIVQDAHGQRSEIKADGFPDVSYAEARLKMAKCQNEPDEVELNMLRIGDMAIVGLPGETFCELGMDIRYRSPAKHTIVCGLSGNAIGYLPTKASYSQGGYETTPAVTYYKPGTGEQLASVAIKSLKNLFSK